MNVLIDFSILFYGNAGILQKISGGLDEERLASMIAVSIDKISSTAMDYGRTTAPILCCDNGESWRKKVFPGYKSNRTYSDISVIRDKMVERFKIDYDVLSYPEMEADDWAFLISSLSEQSSFLVTNDEDWKQFIKPGSIYFHFKTKKVLKFGDINPKYEAFYKLVKGCPTDYISSSVPKGTKRVLLDQVYLRCINLDVEQIFNVAQDFGININLDQLKINKQIATYNIDVLKQFVSMSKIEDDLYRYI